MMERKWMAIPALAATILMGGIALTNAADEMTETTDTITSTEQVQIHASEANIAVIDFDIK